MSVTPAVSPALRRSRFQATALLVLACALFVLSCRFLPQHPAWGYLKAFSEAAMIGGLADWFAVTALFRRPLGLPIPHTAVLPRKQDKIADEIGRFAAQHLLRSHALAAKIYEFSPSQRLLRYLNRPAVRTRTLLWLGSNAQRYLNALPPQTVAQWCSGALAQRLDGRQTAHLLAAVLRMLQQHGFDEALLRRMLSYFRLLLHNTATRRSLEEALTAWAGSIDKAQPSTWDKLKASFKTTLAEQIDDWAAGKILDWADSYLADALNDDSHALRRRWRRWQKQALRRLQNDAVWQRQLGEAVQNLLQSPEVHRALAQWWQETARVAASERLSPQRLRRVWAWLRLQAAKHPQQLRRADYFFAQTAKTAVENYRDQAAVFAAQQIKKWDSRQMVARLENGVGRDLQFIRINGTLVGGCIGLVIYVLSQLLAV